MLKMFSVAGTVKNPLEVPPFPVAGVVKNPLEVLNG